MKKHIIVISLILIVFTNTGFSERLAWTTFSVNLFSHHDKNYKEIRRINLDNSVTLMMQSDPGPGDPRSGTKSSPKSDPFTSPFDSKPFG